MVLMDKKVGVYVYHRGSNIGGIADFPQVVEFTNHLKSVVIARKYKFLCSGTGQEMTKGLNQPGKFCLLRVSKSNQTLNVGEEYG